MSGQAGGRGYLVQTLISVLEALTDDTRWTAIELEPNATSEKVDLIWHYSGRRKAVQIKSSQNQISVPQIKEWAAELEQSVAAEEYELLLIGPISAGVAEIEKHGRVTVPTPQPLNLPGLIHQAAHHLDRYARNRNTVLNSPTVREMVVHALVSRMSVFATQGTPIQRADFDDLLRSWLGDGQVGGAEVGPGHSPSALHQLPPPPADFTGRESEIAETTRRFSDPRVRGCTVRGMPGVGKTSLGLVLCERIAGNYPDAQLYLDMRGTSPEPLQAIEALNHLIRSFHPGTPAIADEQQAAAVYRSVTHRKRILLFLDNVRSEEQVALLIPGPGSFAVLTARQTITLPGIVPCDLSGFSQDDSVQFLQVIAPRAGSHGPAIASICGHLPLALRLAGSTLQGRPDIEPSEFCRRLLAGRAGLETVDASISLSVSLLGEPARRQFYALGAFPADFDLRAGAYVGDIGEDECDAIIETLLKCSLLSFDGSAGRYFYHDLIRLYAWKYAPQEHLSECLTRHSMLYLWDCKSANESYLSGGEGIINALHWFDLERVNIEAGFSFCNGSASQSDSAALACIEYTMGTERCRELRQTPTQQLRWLNAAMAAADRLQQHRTLALLMGNIGRVMTMMGQYECALEMHRRLRETAADLQDECIEAYSWLHSGNARLGMNGYAEARDDYLRCEALAVKIGDYNLQLQTSMNIAASEMNLGLYQEARRRLEDGLIQFNARGELRHSAMALGNLAAVFYQLDDPGRAIDFALQGIEMVETLGDTNNTLTFQGVLAKAYTACKQLDLATQILQARLQLAEDVQDSKSVLDSITQFAKIAAEQKDSAGAEEWLEKGYRIASQVEDKAAEGQLLAIAVDMALEAQNRPKAIELLERRVNFARDGGDGRGVARGAWHLGCLLLLENGEPSRSFGLMQEAIDRLRQMGMANQAEEMAVTLQRLRESDADSPHKVDPLTVSEAGGFPPKGIINLEINAGLPEPKE